MSWLRKQQATLQRTVELDVDSAEQEGVPLVADELVEVVYRIFHPNGSLSDSHSRRSSACRCRTLIRRRGRKSPTAFCYIQDPGEPRISMRCARI